MLRFFSMIICSFSKIFAVIMLSHLLKISIINSEGQIQGNRLAKLLLQVSLILQVFVIQLAGRAPVSSGAANARSAPSEVSDLRIGRHLAIALRVMGHVAALDAERLLREHWLGSPTPLGESGLPAVSGCALELLHHAWEVRTRNLQRTYINS